MESFELKASLQKSLQEWMDNNCEDNAWAALDFYCHPELSQRMAEASYAVLLASSENQHYAKLEGAFKEK